MEKGGARLRQVWFKETNESKLLMTCRNVINDAETGTWTSVPRMEVEGVPVHCSTGVRHEGGVTLIQASVRNSGTCRADAKGEAQADRIRKGESTDAGHRGGVTRNREESSVMGLDRRSGVVQLYRVSNPKGEDPRG
jgi:hypothetical protein